MAKGERQKSRRMRPSRSRAIAASLQRRALWLHTLTPGSRTRRRFWITVS
jgi:hypothetical protein